jgi:hypothetical protein
MEQRHKGLMPRQKSLFRNGTYEGYEIRLKLEKNGHL